MAIETFDQDEQDLDEQDEDEPGPVGPSPRGGGRGARGSVPDAAVENADALPLLLHAATGKSNTVTYLKVTRLDGPRGVRGFKGQMPSETTHLGLARRYGNGTYKIEGCNYRHKVLAREEAIEISIPGFESEETDINGRQREHVRTSDDGSTARFGAHGMKMVADMAREHQAVVRDQAKAQSDNVRDMANSSMKMVTEFTAAQRDTERRAHESMQTNMQQFFASMMSLQQAAHSQQMELITAATERQRKDNDPTQMLDTFIAGMKAVSEMGGGAAGADVEPWLAALMEGTKTLGHLSSIAHSPAAHTTRPGVTALPSGAPPGAPPRRALPASGTSAGTAAPAQGGPKASTRKRRLPMRRHEIRAMAKLRETLRSRGIELSDFLEQTRGHIEQAPESALFSDDDGPPDGEGAGDVTGTDGSDNAAGPTHTDTEPASAT